MGIIEKLTFRYMKKNKKRTKTIIFGIAGTMMMENAVYGLIGCIIGIPTSFILLREVYLEFARYYELDWTMPWDVVPLQVLICILVLVLPMIHTKVQMRHLNIIESIRNENA